MVEPLRDNSFNAAHKDVTGFSTKIALVSDVPPDKDYTGGQVLKHIVDHTPFASVDFYWLNQSHLTTSFTDSPQMKMVYATNFEPGHTLSKIQKFFSFLTFNSERARKVYSLPLKIVKAIRVGRRLSKTIDSGRYDYAWLVLQGELLTVTYLTIAMSGKTKILFHQWDPITWWCSHRGHGKTWSFIFERLISALERRAYYNLVPSYNWQRDQRKQGKNSHRICNFISNKDINVNPKIRSGKDTEIHAVFLGQFYSNEELKKLLEMLSLYATDKSQQLIFHYFGAGNPVFNFPNATIVNHGFVSRETLINTIGQWDFALLPYPMDEKFSGASKYSFPSKSRIYVAAGLPILSYAKMDSSPHVFFKESYSGHYQNAVENSNLEKFVTAACDRTAESNALRLQSSLQLIQDHFSENAELTPLHDLLRK